MNTKTFRLAFGIVLTIALIVAGLCLMGACFQLYRTGGAEPYSAQRVAAFWRPIAVPVYIALVLVVVSIIMDAVLPVEKAKLKMEKNYPLMLKKLHEKNNLDGCGDKNLVAAIRNQAKARKINSLITLALLVLGGTLMLTYGFVSAHFANENATVDIAKAAAVMVISMAPAFGFGLYTAQFCKKSIIREWELMKLVAVPAKPQETPVKSCKWMPAVRCGILVLAVCLIVLGCFGEGFMGVLYKAIAICRECVGIG